VLLLFRAPAAAPASTSAAVAVDIDVDLDVDADGPATTSTDGLMLDAPEEVHMTNPMLKRVAKSPGSVSPQPPGPAIRNPNRRSVSLFRSSLSSTKNPLIRRRDNGSVASAKEAGYSGHSRSSGASGGNNASGGDNSGGALWLVAANVGDCRAVLSRNGQAVPLSFDHKVSENTVCNLNGIHLVQ
jgi:hypothetical protein